MPNSTPSRQLYWENLFIQFLAQHAPGDAAHDLTHIRRVVATAERLAVAEGASLDIVLPAAWLHDCVVVAKDSPWRQQASTLAARAAGDFLQHAGYPETYIPAIQHAIAAHSFSARITPRTLEARVVQDADRLDALGAIGIARCLMLGGQLNKRLYDPADPFARERPLDDTINVLDHFYTKLLRLADTMHTATGRAEAKMRTAYMRTFLQQLATEIKT